MKRACKITHTDFLEKQFPKIDRLTPSHTLDTTTITTTTRKITSQSAKPKTNIKPQETGKLEPSQ